jgi:hypothetical protein
LHLSHTPDARSKDVANEVFHTQPSRKMATKQDVFWRGGSLLTEVREIYYALQSG